MVSVICRVIYTRRRQNYLLSQQQKLFAKYMSSCGLISRISEEKLRTLCLHILEALLSVIDKNFLRGQAI